MFRSDEDLQQWLEAQLEVDLLRLSVQRRTEQPCSYSEEEMYAIVRQRLQSLEDGTAELVDGEEMFSQIRSRYGFEAPVA